ncbi:MAG: hypothetical protein GX442_22445 [Candidatus Riflebacteria bacterium]|nr:hypothetical protein [Candidatus Riflebacteria bacterium]
MKLRLNLILLALCLMTLGTGCVQEKLVIPVATVTGKIVVPPAKNPLGVHITVAGKSGVSTYVNETGAFKLEFREPGRYLLICRGQNYDVDFVWVEAVLEETVDVGNISLNEKIVGEAKWIATIVDFPDATGFKIKSLDPKWATDTVDMYDDGTHDDKVANDGIYTTRVQNIYTGSQLYTIVWTKDGETHEEKKDPHQEFERNGKSEIIIREADSKVARGTVTSALTGVNYSEVVLATKQGARKIFLDSDGHYAMTMEGNGKEYLVFRSPTFHIRAIPVDLTTIPIYDVPPVTLTAKGGGEAKFILIQNDFQTVVNPTVVADFTNWQPQALYDDATHGDEVKGDGVYTLLVTGVAPGYHKYAFNITATNQVRDPYQESGDSQYSILQVK